MRNHLLERLNSSAPPYIDLTKDKNHGRRNIFIYEQKAKILESKETLDDHCQNSRCSQKTTNIYNNGIFNDLFEEDEEMCRICHSESGILISPCICQGSMGFIHDNCLMEWIKTSGKRICELCGTKYQGKKKIMWNFMKWSKPHISSIEYFKILLMILNIMLLKSSLTILNERKFIKRILEINLLPRYHDIVPIIVLILAIVMLLRLIKYFTYGVKGYLNKQKVYKFTNFKSNEVSNNHL